ncbi:MAG: hypothetical protein KC619_33680 [Myxococcales bacterium]|nr:hypothetical protein [Myxococcales bacterium]
MPTDTRWFPSSLRLATLVGGCFMLAQVGGLGAVAGLGPAGGWPCVAAFAVPFALIAGTGWVLDRTPLRRLAR